MTDKELEDKLGKLSAGKTVKKPVAPSAKGPQKNETVELSEEEKEEIELLAASEVADELKLEAVKQYKDAAKQRLKKQALFKQGKDETGDDTELVLITLASHTPFLRVDGSIYYPNRVYRLGQKKAATIKDMMYRGDLHQNEIDGKTNAAFFGHRPRNAVLNPNSPTI